MKYVRVVSDLHLDIDARRCELEKQHGILWFPPAISTDAECCLVIAGDLWTERKFLSKKFLDKLSWIEKIAARFKYVVFVLGNHDYWNTNLTYEISRCRTEIEVLGLSNVFLLENNVIVLDHVKFVGGTLWTDFNHGDPLALFDAPRIMNDYAKIRVDASYRKIAPQDLYQRHKKTKKFIFDNATRDNPAQKVIVVTHMAPSSLSIDERFRADVIGNYYYYSSLEENILDASIDYWLHGHCHTFKDYFIGETRVICNPRGYHGYEITGWDPSLRFEL